MNIGTFSLAMKYVMGLAGTGPWGVGAMIAGLLALLAAAAYGIGKLNKTQDDQELDQGGADAGLTAQGLRNQIETYRAFEARARAEYQKLNVEPVVEAIADDNRNGPEQVAGAVVVAPLLAKQARPEHDGE